MKLIVKFLLVIWLVLIFLFILLIFGEWIWVLIILFLILSFIVLFWVVFDKRWVCFIDWCKFIILKVIVVLKFVGIKWFVLG